MSFNFDDTPDVDADTVAAIVADIHGHGKPPPISGVDRIEHERFMADARWRAEQARAEYDQRQAEKAAAARLESERLAAIAATERRQRLQQEMRKQMERQNRDRTLTGILNQQIEAKQFRQQVLRTQANAAARQRLKSILYSPQPPEPTVVVVQPEDDGSADFGSRNFDVAKWAKKPRSWW